MAGHGAKVNLGKAFGGNDIYVEVYRVRRQKAFQEQETECSCLREMEVEPGPVREGLGPGR